MEKLIFALLPNCTNRNTSKPDAIKNTRNKTFVKVSGLILFVQFMAFETRYTVMCFPRAVTHGSYLWEVTRVL